jgi:TatD DNase family protein
MPKNLKIKPKNNRNEPSYLPHILEEISLHVGRDKEKIALETTSNFKKLFRI